MKNFIKLVSLFGFLLSPLITNSQINEVNTKIDSRAYWQELIQTGVLPAIPDPEFSPPVYKGSQIITPNGYASSPDVLIVEGASSNTQTENSVFVNPRSGNGIVLNSNNSFPGANPNGTSALVSFDFGQTWSNDGGITFSGGTGSVGGLATKSDPAVVVDLNGRSYVNYIKLGNGQGISSSTNNGASWSNTTVMNPFGNTINSATILLDKNHLWVDNSPVNNSIYSGSLYCAWTFVDIWGSGYTHEGQIEFSRSGNSGVNWTPRNVISWDINAGSHNQGVNIQTAPNGDVYAVWAVYDSWPGVENALAFAKSTNGGFSFSPATRIHQNINGIRGFPPSTGLLPVAPHNKNMRTNSFPCMAVDISGGPYNGRIYVVWSNMGVPGINTGSDISIYMIYSDNGGASWSINNPIRVNQDPVGNVQYFPWITCDPLTGDLSVIFYDDRDVGAGDLETWVAHSSNGGINWSDFRVSDVSFTPAPVSGSNNGYMGDYIGISARGGKVYPVWTDNRTGVGTALSYTSPFCMNSCQPDLTINVDVLNNVTDHQEAGNTIKALNTVFSGAEAVYHAGDEVLMLDDFLAEDGSEYRAYINPCNQIFVKSATYDPDESITKPKKEKPIDYFEPSENAIELAIFPNPAQDHVTVSLNKTLNFEAFSLKIYSLSGGLVSENNFSSKTFEQFQIDVSLYRNGVYFVELIDAANNTVYTGKFIKK